MASSSVVGSRTRPPRPVELTSFIGRQAELGQLGALVAARRLVTITGAGGCGKTRLAVELSSARSTTHGDGTAWVDLADVSDPRRVVGVAADAVGILVGPATGAVALAEQLRDRDLLLVVDNCEHLVEAAGQLVDAILRTCPMVTVLATSREPLRVTGETVWRTPKMADADIIELFVERARAVQAGFELDSSSEGVVRTVGRRLDGLPLAIELAAAWVPVLTPAQIADALDDRFQLLVGGPRRTVDRQRTLMASVQWSHGLLDEDARILLQRLSVFAGGFDLDAATAVCRGDGLTEEAVLPALRRLLDASMLERDDRSGRPRFRLLETIRAFAADRLAESGATGARRDAHLDYFLATAADAACELETGDQDDVLVRLEVDHENFRTALTWSWSAPDADRGRALAASLIDLWLLHGHAAEGLPALRRALDSAPDERSALQAKLWSGVALLSMPAGRVDLIAGAAERALELASVAADDAALGRAHLAGCYLAFFSDYARTRRMANLARHHASAAGAYLTVDLAAMFEMVSWGNSDRYDKSLPLADSLLEQCEPRHSRFAGAISRTQAMFGAVLTGDVPRALELGREAASIAEPLRDYFISGTVVSNYAWALGVAGRVDDGRARLRKLVSSIDEFGPDVDVLDLSVTVGKLHLWAGELASAVEWLRRAARYADPGADNWTAARALPSLAAALRQCGHVDDAASAAERGIEMARRLGTPHAEAESLDELGHLALDHEPGRARDLYHEALAVRRTHALRTHLADTLDNLAGAACRMGDDLAAARLVAASDRARAEMGYPRPVVIRATHATLRTTMRAALGDAVYGDAVVEGSALDLDLALDYATRSRGARGRPTVGWESLTPTEHDVATLVAQGLTNPQVAERMFVSRATVKTHLLHIFAKLGIGSRAELAAHVAKHDAG